MSTKVCDQCFGSGQVGRKYCDNCDGTGRVPDENVNWAGKGFSKK